MKTLITHVSMLSNTIIILQLQLLNYFLWIFSFCRVLILIEIQNACPDFWSKTSISGLEFLSRIQSTLEITCFQPPVLTPIRCNSSQHFTAADGENIPARAPRPDKKLLKCVFTGGRVFKKVRTQVEFLQAWVLLIQGK